MEEEDKIENNAENPEMLDIPTQDEGLDTSLPRDSAFSLDSAQDDTSQNSLDELEQNSQLEQSPSDIDNASFDNAQESSPEENLGTYDMNIGDSHEMITVRPVKFQEFEPCEPNRAVKKNLDILQDVSMHITVELGRTKSSIKEVMDMTQGAIVELDKIAGEQVEIYANGKLIAKGEVIVIEDKFGVRVTSTSLPKSDY